jgi:hypothetical protein
MRRRSHFRWFRRRPASFQCASQATALGDQPGAEDELPSDELRADVPCVRSSLMRPHWGAWQKKIDDMWTVQGDIEQQIVARFRAAQREVNDLARRLQAKGKPLPPMPRFVPMLGNRAEPSSNIVADSVCAQAAVCTSMIALVSHSVASDRGCDRDEAFRLVAR